MAKSQKVFAGIGVHQISAAAHANSANIGTESSEYERRENIKMSLSDSFERILTGSLWLLLAVKSNPSETKKQRTDKTSVLWEY